MKPLPIIAGISGGILTCVIAMFACLIYAMSGVISNIPLDYPENID